VRKIGRGRDWEMGEMGGDWARSPVSTSFAFGEEKSRKKPGL